ncbi:glycoside hydrolase family 3 C-terminal domain-containing protein [Vibrio sp. WXL210]|uniref:glycoside hydrolase family 3 C-terminal domain-containing protein n=1 Tax=Vibrio sp. WXL210 TaxID=3450709 RepID=UPI003EC62631
MMRRREFLKKSSAVGLCGLLPVPISMAQIMSDVSSRQDSAETALWQDASASPEERAADLVSRMTVDEKISFFGSRIPESERLGLPYFEWYGEALHGLIAWNCTQFPQNIAMGCTWNPDLMFDVATAISNEARALKNVGEKELMMFSPTVNMARDPRWGRNGECYSEDPHLMSEIARMYVRGMQGNDPKHPKTVTTVKHFVANNIDTGRNRIHSNISEKELYEYYFPAYKTCIVDEEATGMMMGLNGLNGVPCCAHDWLINQVLRDEWGFKGYVIADWTGVRGLEINMHYANSQPEAAAKALKAGVDQECFRNAERLAPMVYALKPALEQGLIEESELDVSVQRLLRLRFMTGEFDDPALSPYSNIPKSVLECDAHIQLARKAAEQSIVMLKNDNALPLSKDLNSIAMIGPFADRCWLGIYSGFPRSKVSPLDGLRQVTNAEITFATGCGVTEHEDDDANIAKAVEAAKGTESVILVVGNDSSTSTENVDRMSLSLPGRQHELIKAVQKVNSNITLVLVPSGPTAISWEQEHIPGIVCAWPNGQEQGNALADVLFGNVNPSGKLCSTWFNSEADLPDLHDYTIENGRTYMYFDGKPLYPFGYGLSYTNFTIEDISLNTTSVAAQAKLVVSATVSNKGKRDGDEIVQVYVKDPNSNKKQALKGFKRVSVAAGQTVPVEITLPYEAFSHYDTSDKEYVVSPGDFEIRVGSSSVDIAATKTIQVAGGVLPVARVGANKSGYFIADDPKRQLAWNYLYPNNQGMTTAATEGDEALGWVEYEITFLDPGFYVATWDATLNFESASKNAVIETSIGGAKIASYQLKQKLNQPIKIPIPPEYGKPVRLRVSTLAGDVKNHSIQITPPGEVPAFVINKTAAQSS